MAPSASATTPRPARAAASPPSRVAGRGPLWGSQRSREGLVAAIVALGAAAVIGIWWTDTARLTSLADEVTAVGRITGLVGTYLLLVEVLLMARIPWLDAAIGMDRLSVWHRRNGEYVVSLLGAHAVLIVAGYALADRMSIGRELGSVVLHYPDMLMAVVALGLLVTVAVLSIRAVRARVAYHTWYFVHLYVYLAAVLAFAHQLATGNEFIGHPLSRAFWILLHLSTLGLLVTYRVGAPLRSAWRHRLRVAKVVREGPGVVSVHIAGERLKELTAEPGQFFLWRFLTRHGWWQAHPYSLSAAPDGRHLRFTAKAVGDHSSSLAKLRPGTPVIAEGPYGNVTGRRRRNRRVLLLAGGIGVGPLRALFESLPARPGDLTFLYRASRDADLVLRAELESLAKERSARLIYAVGPRSEDPLAADRLQSLVPRLAQHDVFVCGPPGFVDHAEDALVAAGVRRTQIHAERFEL